MSKWITITIDTLYEAKLSVVIDLCDQLMVKHEAGRAAGIIAGVVMEVRTAVATCTKNKVDADPNTIPGNLRDLAVDLIVARLKGAIENDLTEDERSNLKWRRDQLEQVAACKLKVDAPDNPIAPLVEGAPGVTLIRPGRPDRTGGEGETGATGSFYGRDFPSL